MTTVDKIYVGDVGLAILLDCGSDVSDATSPKIKCLKPNGTEVDWDAEIYSIDGEAKYLRYLTQASDLNQAGRYRLQASLTLFGWSGRGATATLNVYNRFQ
jgi:hypothetical protein